MDFDTLLFVLVGLLVVIFFRNNMTYRYQCRRAEEILAYNLRQPGTANDLPYSEIGYEAMLFDLTRWSYKSFFPKPPGE